MKAFGDENYNADSVKAPVKDDGTIKIGTKESPTIVKLLVDPRRPEEAFRKTKYHRYLVGNNPQKDGRFMVSRKILQDNDPISDAYWDAHNQLKDLAKTGVDVGDNASDPRVRRLKNLKKTFAEHDRFHLLVLPLNANRPKVLTTVGAVVDLLFGRPAWGDKPATKGLVNEMKEMKHNPFALKIETGWLKIWKTGEGIETRYFAEEYTVERVMRNPETGDEESVKGRFKAKVNPAIFELEVDDVPDLSERDLDDPRMVWTAEECEAYVASVGTTIPERCQKKSRDQSRQEEPEESRTPKNYNPNKPASLFPEDEEPQERDVAPAWKPAPRQAPAQAAAPKAKPKAAVAQADLDEVF